MDPEPTEITIGPYTVDLFLTEDGRLGISVCRNDEKKTVVEVLDVYVLPSLNPDRVLTG